MKNKSKITRRADDSSLRPERPGPPARGGRGNWYYEYWHDMGSVVLVWPVQVAVGARQPLAVRDHE